MYSQLYSAPQLAVGQNVELGLHSAQRTTVEQFCDYAVVWQHAATQPHSP